MEHLRKTGVDRRILNGTRVFGNSQFIFKREFGTRGYISRGNEGDGTWACGND